MRFNYQRDGILQFYYLPPKTDTAVSIPNGMEFYASPFFILIHLF